MSRCSLQDKDEVLEIKLYKHREPIPLAVQMDSSWERWVMDIDMRMFKSAQTMPFTSRFTIAILYIAM